MRTKTLIKALILTFGITSVFTACENDKIDTKPPAIVSGLTAVPKNQSVYISWTCPEDIDFALTRIVYEKKTIEVGKANECILIEGLENGKKYSFEVSSVDLKGNCSECQTVKSTPDKYVTKVDAHIIERATYETVGETYPTTITFDGDKYKRSMLAGDTEYIWEGIWSQENDTMYLFSCEYYTVDFRGVVHVANLQERINIPFCYNYFDSIFYVADGYKKIEGDESFISGKYRYFRMTTSNDDSSYNDTTFYYATFSESGEITYTDSDNNSSTDTWGNEDLLAGRFIFVSFNSQIYLVDRNRRKYKKK